LIHVSDSNVITIAGGKWTTYRKMAEDCVDKAIEVYHLNPKYRSCQTERIPLIGAEGYSPTLFIKLVQQFGLDKRVSEHLVRSYGDRAFAVAQLAKPTGLRWPVLGTALAGAYPYLDAEILYGVRNEYALTAVDILARRTRLAFLNANAAFDSLPKVIATMGDELGWTRERREREFQEGRQFLLTMGMEDTSEAIRSDFNAVELVNYREAFVQIDLNHDGHLDFEEIKAVFGKLGQSIEVSELKMLFEEADSNHNGTLEFNEFLDLMSKIKHSEKQSKYHIINAKFGDLIEHLRKPIDPDRSSGGL